MLLRKQIKKIFMATICFLLIASTLLSISAFAASEKTEYTLDHSFYADVTRPTKTATTKNEARRMIRYMYYNHKTAFTEELVSYQKNGKTIKIAEEYRKTYQKGGAAARSKLQKQFAADIASHHIFARKELYEYSPYYSGSSITLTYDRKANKLYCTYTLRYNAKYDGMDNLTVPEQIDTAFTECEKIALSLYKNKIITPTSSAKDKAKAVYDYICKNYSYDYSLQNHTIYLMLKNKTGTCAAFSGMYAYICKLLGLRMTTEYGYTYKNLTGEHCWNKVKVGNEYRYTDVTWGCTYSQRYAEKHPKSPFEVKYKYFWQTKSDFFQEHYLP